MIETLQKLTGYKYILLTNRCNTAIYLAIKTLKELGENSVAILDQGGWITYEQYARQLDMKTERMETEDLLIIEKQEYDNILLTEPAGYAVYQDPEKIAAKKYLILDICGSIGKPIKYNADIIVCSFGKWKPIDARYGGFLGTNNEQIYEIAKKHCNEKLAFIEEKIKPKILDKIKHLDERYKFIEDKCKKIKEDLSEFDIIHPEMNGIVVIVKYKDDTEKDKITSYCEKNDLPYEECPRYIRYLGKAISIEVKRLTG